MKILLCVKRVVDPYVAIRVKSDHSGVETQNVKMSMNPFDEIAVEEAVRLQEAGIAKELIVASIGPSRCQETLRSALALGADRAIWVNEEQECSPLTVAKVLASIAQQEAVDLVLLGKQAIDGDNNQTGQMLAGLLDWSQGTFISELNIEGQQALIKREVDGGIESLALQLPAVLTTDLRLNEPRFAALPKIMQAKRKPLHETSLAELAIAIDQSIEVLSVEPPPKRQAGVRVASVEELLTKLRDEAGVIA